MIDLDALEAAAKAATGCRWSKGYKSVYADTGDEVASCTTDRIITNRQAEANAAYIAAVNPDVVLELIAELRKARATRASLEHWQRVAAIIADVLVDYQKPAGVPLHKRDSQEQILRVASYAAAREAVEEQNNDHRP